MRHIKFLCAALVAVLFLNACLGDSENSISPQSSFSHITLTEEGQLIAKTSEGIVISLPSAIDLSAGDCAKLSYKQKGWNPAVVNNPEYVQIVQKFPSQYVRALSNTKAPGYEEFYPTGFGISIFRQHPLVLNDRMLFTFTANKEDITSNVSIHFVYDKAMQYETIKGSDGQPTNNPLEKNQAVIDVYFVKDPAGISIETSATSTQFASNLSNIKYYFDTEKFDESAAVSGYVPVTFKLRYTRTKPDKETEEIYLGSWPTNDGVFFMFPVE